MSNASIQLINEVMECPSCGLVQHYPKIQHGELAACGRCGHELFRHPLSRQWSVGFAFAISSAILYLMMILFPLLSINIYGRENSLGVFDGSIEFMSQGWNSVGILVGMVIILVPFVVIVLMLFILSLSLRRELPSYFPLLLYTYKVLRPWSMIEVYILGVFVAYTKLVGMAYVHIDYALYSIILLMISMSITDATVDFSALWNRCPVRKQTHSNHGMVDVAVYEGSKLPEHDHVVSCECCHLVFVTKHSILDDGEVASCPRCGRGLHKRKPNSINKALALLIAAFIFYIPANLYPIMTMTMMGKESSHQILGGVIELWQSKMVPLALLVFFASITVPVLKIAGISVMIGASLLGSKRYLITRSKLFQVISFVGRWSMIDVFMISILIALIKFNALANVQADAGIVTFAAVVILTIFSADFFDPRLMWDLAGMNSSQNEQK